MANQIPFSGATDAGGGYLLPPEQGAMLTNGLLQRTGSLQLAGDARATTARKWQFTIWLGAPTAGVVGEGARKPVTGGELGTTELNVKKIASIVLFTDEMIEDLRNGDLNALVDTGVREAIADVIDQNILGKDSGANVGTAFDSMLRSTTATIELGTENDALRRAVSSAMGLLEANGYGDNNAILLGPDLAQHLRDARAATEATTAIYDQVDPLYGLPRYFSTNLNGIGAAAAAGNIVAFVVHRPNLHVRVRKDVAVSRSTEATINDGVQDRYLFQENLAAVRYETRLGFMVHDMNRAVVAITNAA
jgi:hypothetical protein